MEDMRYLTFALGKGRLANQTLETFEKIGITCEEMKDKKTRKLIFVNEEYKLRFFLAKGPDVPTYVEYGAADIGIVGKDTILEEGRNIYEVLDLGFGKCKMCVCGPKEAEELLKHREQIRVATKYPKIANDYFYNKLSDNVKKYIKTDSKWCNEVISSTDNYTKCNKYGKKNAVGLLSVADINNSKDKDGNLIETTIGGYLDIGLNDTMKDLMVNFLGAITFNLIAYLYIKGNKKYQFVEDLLPTKASNV